MYFFELDFNLLALSQLPLSPQAQNEQLQRLTGIESEKPYVAARLGFDLRPLHLRRKTKSRSLPSCSSQVRNYALLEMSVTVRRFDRPSSLFLLNFNLLYLTVGTSFFATTWALLDHNRNRVTSAGTTLIGQLGSCVQARTRLDNSHNARHRHIAFLYSSYQKAIRSLLLNNYWLIVTMEDAYLMRKYTHNRPQISLVFN